MAFRIVRNDITKMQTEAIVNTANEQPAVGTGCDTAIYKAAGKRKLLAYRKEQIGFVPQGEVFITPGFALKAKYIIHAVSPYYVDGKEGEEEKLRSCYRKSLQLAKEHGIRSIAFPLISTGGFGYPKEEGMRIAADEINAFLLENKMEVFLVVFDEKAKKLGKRLDPKLEEYIDRHYVEEKTEEEYREEQRARRFKEDRDSTTLILPREETTLVLRRDETTTIFPGASAKIPVDAESAAYGSKKKRLSGSQGFLAKPGSRDEEPFLDFESEHESKLKERMRHLSDTFSQYLMYLISDKGMENADVYKRAIVDKKIFSKIKNNTDYHPQKLTALCLCIGAKLNLDETKDLLARAGYALSPCDKTDIIFSYFIENGIYDMIELDIQLEEHGLPCVIS